MEIKTNNKAFLLTVIEESMIGENTKNPRYAFVLSPKRRRLITYFYPLLLGYPTTLQYFNIAIFEDWRQAASKK